MLDASGLAFLPIRERAVRGRGGEGQDAVLPPRVLLLRLLATQVSVALEGLAGTHCCRGVDTAISATLISW